MHECIYVCKYICTIVVTYFKLWYLTLWEIRRKATPSFLDSHHIISKLMFCVLFIDLAIYDIVCFKVL